MASRTNELDGQPTADSTPEDVAALYSWANLQGANYRDYSASRREYRAQVRYRAATSLLESELRAQAEAKATAALSELAAETAEATAPPLEDGEGHAQSLQTNEAAAAERVETARRAESVARAGVLALREEREVDEAHSLARRQAMMYEESELRRRLLAGPQPHVPAGSIGDLKADGLEDARRSQRPNKDSSPAEKRDDAAQKDRSDASQTRWSGEIPQSLPTDRSEGDTAALPPGPAWVWGSQTPPTIREDQTVPTAGVGGAPVARAEMQSGDTLLDSRERVAARWFALKGVFQDSGPELSTLQPARPGEVKAPMLLVFSLAGGVGKTSLVAALGRALAAQGERVLLTDTTSHGLLTIYMGAREIRPGAVCTFPPPPGSNYPPMSLVIQVAGGRGGDARRREMLAEEILWNAQGSHRVLLDLASDSSWLIQQLSDIHPTVLVPMAPDMNSVISMQAVERLFRTITDAGGRPLVPYYVLNQFDVTLPLHLDVREVFRRQLGERLLPIAIRRSPAVSEALAEGMTVLDYAPSAPVGQDYLDVASWLRSISAPASADFRTLRWGVR